MNILIVEDEPKTGDHLRQGLRETGFTADLTTTGPEGLHLASHTEPTSLIQTVRGMGYTLDLPDA